MKNVDFERSTFFSYQLNRIMSAGTLLIGKLARITRNYYKKNHIQTGNAQFRCCYNLKVLVFFFSKDKGNVWINVREFFFFCFCGKYDNYYYYSIEINSTVTYCRTSNLENCTSSVFYSTNIFFFIWIIVQPQQSDGNPTRKCIQFAANRNALSSLQDN